MAAPQGAASPAACCSCRRQPCLERRQRLGACRVLRLGQNLHIRAEHLLPPPLAERGVVRGGRQARRRLFPRRRPVQRRLQGLQGRQVCCRGLHSRAGGRREEGAGEVEGEGQTEGRTARVRRKAGGRGVRWKGGPSVCWACGRALRQRLRQPASPARAAHLLLRRRLCRRLRRVALHLLAHAGRKAGQPRDGAAGEALHQAAGGRRKGEGAW